MHAMVLLKLKQCEPKKKKKTTASYCPTASTKKSEITIINHERIKKEKRDQITRKGGIHTPPMSHAMGAIQAKSLKFESIGYRESGRERSQGSQLKPFFLAVSFIHIF